MIRRNTLLILIAIVLLIISGIIFLFINVIIPKKENIARNELRTEIDIEAMPSIEVPILIIDKLEKYTILTDEVISDSFYMVKIPEKFLVTNHIVDLNNVHNQVLTEALYKNQQLSKNILKNKNKVFSDDERLSAFKLFGIEAYKLMEGILVDILVIYEDRSYDIVVPKITIESIIRDSNDNEKYSDNSYIFGFFALDEDEYCDLEKASQFGTIEIRTYLDDEQKSSIKTFDLSKHKEE